MPIKSYIIGAGQKPFVEEPFLWLQLSTLTVVVSIERLSSMGAPSASQNANVGPSKGGIAQGVQNRVDG